MCIFIEKRVLCDNGGGPERHVLQIKHTRSELFLPSVADSIFSLYLTLITVLYQTTFWELSHFTSGEVHSLEPGGCAKTLSPKKRKNQCETGRFHHETKKSGKTLARSSFVLKVLCT